MDNKTEQILKKDSIAETEKIFGGKHWSDFNDTENVMMLGMALIDNHTKGDYLKSIGDTYFQIPWNDFKRLIINKGFVPGMEYDFKHDNNETDEFIIYYHPKKGLIICATSYYNKSVINDGTLYGEIQANNENDVHTIYKWLSTGGYIDKSERIFSTSHDIREGLFSTLDELETAGVFLPHWIEKNKFLWFSDYKKKKTKGFDYKKISKEKLLKCPKELQDIVGIERRGV